MTRYELEGIRIPVDHFGITIEELPVKLRPVFLLLERAAEIGGELYALQIYYLDKYQELIAYSDDPEVKNPFTVPTKEGKFVDFFDHPSFKPLLHDAQTILMNAAESARNAEDDGLANYLWTHGLYLTQRRYDEIFGECIKLRSRINFHLLPVETELDKRVWQGYAAIDDSEETREVRHDIEALREAGIRKNNGVWFSPRTDMRVDNVSVMSGWLGTEAQRRRMGFKGSLLEQGGISATNIPNKTELVREYGTRITVFSGPFNNYAYSEIVKLTKPFTEFQMSRRGCLRFIAAHELTHDERYDDSRERVGILLHTTLRESYANVAGIDLSAEVWDPVTNAFIFGSVIRGATGYAIRDCYDILTEHREKGQYPDLENMAKRSSYIPGSLGLLNSYISGGAYEVRNGSIIAIDGGRAHAIASRLAKEQQKLLKLGTEQDTRDHFESLLPKKPLFITSDHATTVA